MLELTIRVPEFAVDGMPFSSSDLNNPLIPADTCTGLRNAYECDVPFEYANFLDDIWEHVYPTPSTYAITTPVEQYVKLPKNLRYTGVVNTIIVLFERPAYAAVTFTVPVVTPNIELSAIPDELVIVKLGLIGNIVLFAVKLTVAPLSG
jgi:hypothetical protein